MANNSKKSARSTATCDNLMSPVNVLHNSSKKQASNVARLEKLLTTTDKEQHKAKTSNWSGNADNNNTQQEQLKFLKKLNNDLYSEAAAQLLGLSCTLCDNCRCMDCQSGYFECDDWDSNSDLSVDVMDEYDEPFVWDTSTRYCMQPCDYYYDDMTTTAMNENKQSLYKWHNNVATNGNNCMEINCDVPDSQYSKVCEYSAIAHDALSTHKTYNALTHATPHDDNNDSNSNAISTDCSNSNNCMNIVSIGNGKNVSIQGPKQPQYNELENCAHFNELSLLDSQSPAETECMEKQLPEIVVQ